MQKGIIDRFRSLPMAPSAVLVGRTTSDVAINIIVIAVMSVTGLIVGWRIHTSASSRRWRGFLLLLAFAYGISWVMAWVGLLVRTPEVVNNAAFIIIFPLTFIANTFVPASTLPGAAEDLRRMEPGVRGHPGGPGSCSATPARQLPPAELGRCRTPWPTPLIWVGLILVLFIPLSIRQYRRAASR